MMVKLTTAVILGIISLPSVSKSLSWQEFRLIQVTIVFLTRQNSGSQCMIVGDPQNKIRHILRLVQLS